MSGHRMVDSNISFANVCQVNGDILAWGRECNAIVKVDFEKGRIELFHEERNTPFFFYGLEIFCDDNDTLFVSSHCSDAIFEYDLLTGKSVYHFQNTNLGKNNQAFYYDNRIYVFSENLEDSVFVFDCVKKTIQYRELASTLTKIIGMRGTACQRGSFVYLPSRNGMGILKVNLEKWEVEKIQAIGDICAICFDDEGTMFSFVDKSILRNEVTHEELKIECNCMLCDDPYAKIVYFEKRVFLVPRHNTDFAVVNLQTMHTEYYCIDEVAGHEGLASMYYGVHYENGKLYFLPWKQKSLVCVSEGATFLEKCNLSVSIEVYRLSIENIVETADFSLRTLLMHVMEVE